MANMLRWLKGKARDLKHDLVALYIAVHDPRVGSCPKLLAFAALGYALSPIDLIPDFIPVLGLLDDLIILPLLLWLAIKLIPTEIMEEARSQARDSPKWLPVNWYAATIFFALQLVVVLSLFRAFLRLVEPSWPIRTILIVSGVVITAAFIVWAVWYEKSLREDQAIALEEGEPLLPASPTLIPDEAPTSVQVVV